MSILKYDDIDISKINYSKPEKIGPSYFGSISYGDNLKPLMIQTGKMKCLNSIEGMKDKKNPYLEIEIPKGKFDMYDLFLSLDDQNIKTTVKNSQEWFGKDLPLEAIDDMYKRTTKPFKKDSNPTLKFKLPVIKNEIQSSVYNQQKVFVDLNEVKEDYSQCGGSLKDSNYGDKCDSYAGIYSSGAWAHAYLANKYGNDVLLEVFYPNLEEMGFESAFMHAYGQTLEEFYVEFDQFLDLPLNEQLAILP